MGIRIVFYRLQNGELGCLQFFFYMWVYLSTLAGYYYAKYGRACDILLCLKGIFLLLLKFTPLRKKEGYAFRVYVCIFIAHPRAYTVCRIFKGEVSTDLS